MAAAVVAAEAAVFLLRPRGGVIDPEPVRATWYFSPAELARGRAFRRGQLALYGARVAVQGAFLAGLVARPPRVLREWGPRRRRRVLPSAAASGAAMSVAMTVVTLPVAVISRRRAIVVGLVRQSWRGWAGDVAKATAIEAVAAGAGGAVAVGLMRRFPRGWWMPAGAGAAVVAGGVAFAGPVLLDPVFDRFERLEGEARDDVLELAARAGVSVGEVFGVDASRRTTAANAYVTGLGRTKRVVIYDTLLTSFTRDERRLVIAHELAHMRHRDVGRGLAFLALVAPFALRAAALLTDALARRDGGERAGAEAVPALALALMLVAPPLGFVGNRLSRQVEARADTFALELTEAPEPFIDFERRITIQNVSDPDPPAWAHWLLGTHPTTLERIGAGKAWEHGEHR